MRDAVQYEKNMNEFFMSIKAAIMADDKKLKKWTDAEKELHAEYEYRTRQGRARFLFSLLDHISTWAFFLIEETKIN